MKRPILVATILAAVIVSGAVFVSAAGAQLVPNRNHPAEASTQYDGWAIPWPIVKCESGGRNLPPNRASAAGYYQIISSTWAAYGGRAFAPRADLATKAQQSIIAARIWDGGRGASQWVCAKLTGY